MYRDNYTLFSSQRFEFDKKNKFRLCEYGIIPDLLKVCFAAIGACTFFGAFFYC